MVTHPTRAEFDKIIENVIGERLPGRPRQDIWTVSSVQNYTIGSRFQEPGPFGRTFHYCEAVAEIANSFSAPVGLTTWRNADVVVGTPVVTAKGAKAITAAAAGIAANELKGAVIRIKDADPDFRYMMKVIGNTATDGSGNIVIYLEEGLPIALTAADELKLYWNVWRGVQLPTNVGVHSFFESMVAVCLLKETIPINNYFWGQTWGPCYAVNCSADPGDVAADRSVYFNTDGAIMTATEAEADHGGRLLQYAGFCIPGTLVGDGSCYFMLQLSP